MLLKKSLSKFVSLKKHRKDSKPTNALPLGRKGRFGFSAYTALVLCACCFSTTAFAANDPLAVVNNLSTFIFSLIRAVGPSFWAGAWCRSVCPFRATIPPSVPKDF